MKSWACLNSKSSLDGRGRVSNIGPEGFMETSGGDHTSVGLRRTASSLRKKYEGRRNQRGRERIT